VKRFNAGFLVPYTVIPWAAVYIGYDSDQQNINLIRTSKNSELIPTYRFLNDGRQFFVKFTYFFGF
jgi:hypothetical protein